MFGVDLNKIQYAELEWITHFPGDSKALEQSVHERISKDVSLLNVYYELRDKGLVDGNGWNNTYHCRGLTSNGRSFVSEYEAKNAAEQSALKSERRHQYRIAAFSFTGSTVLGIIAAMVTSVITTLLVNSCSTHVVPPI
jgi:hypothetical protein